MSRTLRGEIWGLSFAATHSDLVIVERTKHPYPSHIRCNGGMKASFDRFKQIKSSGLN